MNGPTRSNVLLETGVGPRANGDLSRFNSSFRSSSRRFDVGTDFYSPPEFEGGLLIYGKDIALKIGGYVKADFIYDFNAIDSTDSFDTTTIDVGGDPRTNTRFHARQSRLSFDTRWDVEEYTVKIFVESDFFSDGDRYRLRHAYGEVGPIMVGQNWTTFSDVAAAPNTLDFEGSVSSINRRQAQARITGRLFSDSLSYAVAVEDARIILELPPGVDASARTMSPDFIGRIKLSRDWGQFQAAGVYRVLGGQAPGGDVRTRHGWGLNTTSVVLITQNSKVYSQVLVGEGIGSYRGLPDIAPVSASRLGELGLFAWMLGTTVNWSEKLSSNLTYAQNELNTSPFNDPDSVKKTTYMAANLIWSPVERVRVGVEYLFGSRVNTNLEDAEANRLQMAYIFDLP